MLRSALADFEWEEAVGIERCRIRPDIVSGQIDVVPPEGRELPQSLFVTDPSAYFEGGHSSIEIPTIEQDDCCGDEVQRRSTRLLVFMAAITETTPRQGLRADHRLSDRLALHRFHPTLHPPHRKAMKVRQIILNQTLSDCAMTAPSLPGCGQTTPSGWLLVGADHVGALLTSFYGCLLMLKLIVFIGMLGLAARNRFSLTPAMRLNGTSAFQEPGDAKRPITRSVAFEAGLALVVLGLVAWLGTLSPPASGM